MFIYVRKKEKKKLEAPLTQYSHSHIVQGSPFSFFLKRTQERKIGHGKGEKHVKGHEMTQ